MHNSDNTLVIDVDGTICDDVGRGADYSQAVPILEVRDQINKYFDYGWYIIYSTSRYYTLYQGNLTKIFNHGGAELTSWLKKHGFKYHEIHMGKPSAKYYIDNNAWRVQNMKDWQELDKRLTQEI